MKSTSGDTHLGGDDFDHVIVDWIADEFKRNEGIDLRKDPQALQRLTEASEKAKIELSAMTEASISLPFITANETGPKHLDMRLTRSKFNELTRHLVEKCRAPVEQALADAGLKTNEVDEVVLVGGSTRIPAVQDLVKSLTGGKEPNQSVNPDEVVAIGAAIQAGVIGGEVRDVVLLDVTPLSLGIETMGGVFTKLVERNTTIPTHKSETCSTAEDNQPAVDIQVYQGERPMARDNKLLGTFRLDGIRPAARGLPRIEVSFDIDANGILNVTAKDMGTGKEQKITITASTNLNKDDIERMIKEAESNSQEDKKNKESADTRNEADNLCYTVEREVREGGATEANKTRAEELVADVRRKIEARASADELKPLMNDLRGLIVQLQQDAAASRQSSGGAPGGSESSSGSNGHSHGSDSTTGSGAGDDIVDAEVT